MTRDAHDEARQLIALGEGLADAQQVWLWAHLNECEDAGTNVAGGDGLFGSRPFGNAYYPILVASVCVDG